MKIKSVEPIKGFYVYVEDSDYSDYIRYSKDNWMVRMGESYESIYNDEELEHLFQEYIKEHLIGYLTID